MFRLIKKLNLLLSQKSKNQIFNIQIYYFLSSITEFLNISFFYTFLLTLFNEKDGRNSFLINFLNNTIGVQLDIFYISIFLVVLFSILILV